MIIMSSLAIARSLEQTFKLVPFGSFAALAQDVRKLYGPDPQLNLTAHWPAEKEWWDQTCWLVSDFICKSWSFQGRTHWRWWNQRVQAAWSRLLGSSVATWSDQLLGAENQLQWFRVAVSLDMFWAVIPSPLRHSDRQLLQKIFQLEVASEGPLWSLPSGNLT